MDVRENIHHKTHQLLQVLDARKSPIRLIDLVSGWKDTNVLGEIMISP